MSSDFYVTLGVSQTATRGEIVKAYRQLALHHHPDKGGDEKKFQEITQAYSVLSDESKRRMYDLGWRGGDRDSFDILMSRLDIDGLMKGLFGTRKSVTIHHTYHATIEDVCRRVVKTVRIKTFHLGKHEEKKFTLPLSPEKSKHIFKGQGHRYHGCDYGDVVIEVQTLPHPSFRREGLSLYLTSTISLRDALCGALHLIHHPDGSQIEVDTTSTIITPVFVYEIPGKGMNRDGNLFISFNVTFPTELDDEKKEILQELLPP